MDFQETDRQIVKEFVVAPEHLSGWRLAVGALREKPGLEDRTLYLANFFYEAADKLGEHENAFHFLLEQSLVWQHVFMEERDKFEGSDEERMLSALEKMEETAMKAEEYRVAHNLEDLRGDSLRFLGRVASSKGEDEKALAFYQESKKLLLAMPSEEPKRIRWIEVQGFEAEALIMTGRPKEGLTLARRTWVIYPMHEFDLYTHKVWQSGVGISTVRALVETGNIELLGRQGAEKWLDEAQALLVIPEDMETWGDRNFTTRRREIRKLKEELSKLE